MISSRINRNGILIFLKKLQIIINFSLDDSILIENKKHKIKTRTNFNPSQENKVIILTTDYFLIRLFDYLLIIQFKFNKISPISIYLTF